MLQVSGEVGEHPRVLRLSLLDVASSGSAESKSAMSSLGCWVPPDTATCLQPEDVARVVVDMVDIMDKADVTEVNVENVKKHK